MKVSFFIDRPVFSIVISILIVIVGFIGLTMLPIDQYPQITPPVVKISASYPGASALTVAQAVATPIEQQLNGTPGMLYMESLNTTVSGECDDSGICHVESCDSTTAEVVGTWAVDDIEFFVIELDVANCGKNGITVFLFYWEIVADGGLCFNSTATFNDPALKEHGFHEGSLTRATATHEGNVLNLVSLINFSHNCVY
mgnify:CR=1 FL=1